ncbi:unnamed protein product [Closterium sp. NIES-53]
MVRGIVPKKRLFDKSLHESACGGGRCACGRKGGREKGVRGGRGKGGKGGRGKRGKGGKGGRGEEGGRGKGRCSAGIGRGYAKHPMPHVEKTRT